MLAAPKLGEGRSPAREDFAAGTRLRNELRRGEAAAATGRVLICRAGIPACRPATREFANYPSSSYEFIFECCRCNMQMLTATTAVNSSRIAISSAGLDRVSPYQQLSIA